jgi:hypothetical protein
MSLLPSLHVSCRIPAGPAAQLWVSWAMQGDDGEDGMLLLRMPCLTRTLH